MAQAGARGAKGLGAGGGGDRCETGYQKVNLERAIRGDFLEEVMPERSSSEGKGGVGGDPNTRDRPGILRRPEEGPGWAGVCVGGVWRVETSPGRSDLAGGGRHFWAARSHRRGPRLRSLPLPRRPWAV